MSEDGGKKKRVKIDRVKMPEQDPEVRRFNFEEVALGLDAEAAAAEASRCLQCKKKPCVAGCPVEIDIPAFIKLIEEGDPMAAAAKLKEKNSLPAICGRVCPQETQCEAVCTLGRKGEPVAIGRLERFAADYEAARGEIVMPPKERPTGKRVAVIGSGPGGLTCAGDLARMGHEVTIFEALNAPGGVLTYGIPEFRLPKAIVMREVEYVRRLGVEIRLDQVIGCSYTLQELFADGYDAAFIAIGAGLPMFMDIPGENLNGVYSANEYLTRSNLMKAYLFPDYDTPIKRGKRVAVIGGGNVALDSARTALRLGAEEVTIVYRRSRQEMPARAEEIAHAAEEGVAFKFLTLPVRILGDEWVRGMECLRMELGEPDESGRRRPVPIKGSEFELEVDLVVMAIGTRANPLLTSTLPEVKLNKWGYIEADPETGQTSVPNIFAGGDIVTGSATVIEAMGAGKRAARAIHSLLS
ncbi:MAG: NADPH-dependent glutamate synthase [Actinobacteria bacterium]|nr:NADPH-dependent glutamate synthase [Actinomycetota bacterium]MDI6832018.1 NADPH-dependent glutamate synthase [Actinomycetota bacterium]